MSLNRREFLRRVVAASSLIVVGLVSTLELVKSAADNGTAQANGTLVGELPSPGAGAQNQSLATRQTVTVTETVNGSSQRNSTNSAQTSQTSSSTSQPVPPGYVLVTPLGAIAGRTSAYFNHPSAGLSLLVSVAGQWKAFSATCTHAPCTVQFAGSSIQCPCHGGAFDPGSGAVQAGPPPSPLPQLGVLVQDGNLYVTA